MRSMLNLTAFVLMLLTTTSLSAQIAWQTDLQTAHKAAQSSGKLMLVHFYSDNCVWCDRLEAGAFTNPQLADAINRDFVPVKIHAGKTPSIAAHFGVTQWPTDVIVDSTGLVHGRGVSPQAPNEYGQMLVASLQHAAGTPATPPNTMVAQNSTPPSQQAIAPAQNAGQVSGPVAQTTPAPSVPNQTAPQAPGMSLPPSLGQTVAHRTNPSQSPVAPATESIVRGTPPVAMDGFCAVSVTDDRSWIPGDRAWGAVHLGQTYLFASEAAQKKFLADPFRYAPVLTGLDVVHFFDRQVAVAGKRELSCTYNDRTYLFSDQESYDRFDANCDHYDQLVNQAVQRIAMEATNDGRIVR